MLLLSPPLSTAAVLLADAPDVVRADWLEGLAPVVLLLFWIARQFFSAVGEQKEAKRLQRERPAPQPAMGPDEAFDGPAEEPQQGELRNEVDEFLKRIEQMRDDEPAAAEARAAQIDARGMSPPVEDPRQRGPIDPFEEPVRRRPSREPRTPEIELIVEDEPRARISEPIAPMPARPRVELRHLPESQLSEQAAKLGAEVGQADERLEARLHEKFDHRLGRLASQPDANAPDPNAVEPETGATRIKKLLARPGGVREAVILSEILRRPADSL